MILEINESNLYLFYSTLIIFISYLIYVIKFRHYIYEQVDDIKNGSKPRGKCPPFFPNGWYRMLNSNELKRGKVKYLDYCGRNIAIFRGNNDIVYAMHAFCPHMGANLAIGGLVKQTQCLQCPFHGWTFDGESGDCLNTTLNLSNSHNSNKIDAKNKKVVQTYEYNDVKRASKSTKNDELSPYFYKCHEGNVTQKTYKVKEINGSILVWLDSREKIYDYEPLTVQMSSSLEYRGESINYVNCHIQEVPENGADIRHFDFLHTNFIAFIKFEWSMTSHRATEPNILDLMTQHKKSYVNKFKLKVLERYLTEANKNYVNVINLDCYMKIFGFKFFFFNATGFQVGPALVYLFLKSYFFEIIFEQAIIPMKRFHQRVSHKIYASWYLPYWLTAFMLYSEVTQVYNDMNIWNNKIFGSKLNYNMKTEADKNLFSWRNWFAQFYEGCYDFEKSSDLNDW